VTYVELLNNEVDYKEQANDTYISLNKGYVKVGNRRNKVVAISKPTKKADELNYLIYFKKENTGPEALNEFEVKSYLYNNNDRTLYIAWELDDNKHAWLAYKLK
jgi:hypothetical protein